MASISTTADTLAVTLTTREKIAALHGDVSVPLSAVRSVRVEPDALAAVSGLRAPGVAVPGRTKIGVWRGHGRRRFVVARRALPAVCVTLDGARHDELIISAEHAEQIAEQIRTAAARVANASDADVDQPEGAT